MDSLIQVSRLGYRYNHRWVVKGVDFELFPGELVGLIGPNGSGKTTLLKLIAHLLTPKEGQVLWEGQPLAQFSQTQIARRMALVSQDPAFVFPPTVLEVILMGRSPYLKRFQLEGSLDLHLAEAAMAQTQVTSLQGRRLNELSSGEKQRVLIARALCQEPSLLLLDEPTAFLDIKHQVKILDLVLELNREKGLTILVASHDINLAAQYCRRLILIREGRIEVMGHPGQVISESTIQKVFDTTVVVDQNPLTRTPRITLVSGHQGHA